MKDTETLWIVCLNGFPVAAVKGPKDRAQTVMDDLQAGYKRETCHDSYGSLFSWHLKEVPFFDQKLLEMNCEIG